MSTFSHIAIRDPEHLATLGFLALRGVGPVTLADLREKFGSLHKAAEAGPEVFGSELRQDARADLAEQPDLRVRAEKLLADCARHGAWVLFRDQPGWPTRLRDLGRNEPQALFIRGTLDASLRTAAVVGTRDPTKLGLTVATKLGEVLAGAGVVTVSGGAKGIDAASHEGALKAKGPTWAILGSGFDRMFPAGNKALFERIVDEGGALVTELPPAHETKPGNFPRRNALVAALAEVMVVVQGDSNSGAMIAATCAKDLRRPLLAVPGDVTCTQANGPNLLLRKGEARACGHSSDVLVALGLQQQLVVLQEKDKAGEGEARNVSVEPRIEPLAEPQAPSGSTPLDASLEPVFRALRTVPQHFDDLLGAVQWPAPTLAAALTQLELLGLAEQRPGKLFVRRAR